MRKRKAPPRLAEWLLRWVMPPGVAGESIVGDAREEFHEHLRSGSVMPAALWYWLHILPIAARFVSHRGRRSSPRVFGSTPTYSRDVRYACRTLRRQPVFTAVAVLTLGLGIGATTGIFTIVNGVLLRPLPFDDPEALVAIWHKVTARGADRFPMSAAMYLTYREEQRVFQDIGMWTATQVSVTGQGGAERLEVVAVTDGVFAALRVQPLVGRLFTARDESPGAAATIVLSYRYWQQRFGGSSRAIGRTVRVNGTAREIIGVLPAVFRYLDLDPALYVPFRMSRETIPPMGGGFGFQGIARLSPGMTLDDANRDLARVLPMTVEKFPGRRFSLATLEEWGLAPNLIPLKEDVVGDVRAVMWILFGTMGLVLLIAGANVTNLLLVRAEGRQREIAVRTALGASRGLIARQFVAESVVLGLLGGVAGLGVAYSGVWFVLRLAPDHLPRMHEVSVNGAVLLFALGVSTVAGLLPGVFSLVHYGRPEVMPWLKQGGRVSSEGSERHRMRKILVVSEIALALVLLIGSGLMIRSFHALRTVHPGFERPREILTLRLPVPPAETQDPTRAVQLHEQILDGLSHIPGVNSVGAVSAVTLDRRSPSYATFVEGVAVPENQFPPSRRYKWIAGDYFGTMENGVLAGRGITWDDIRNRAKVVVVTENFAREFWGEPRHAVGKRITNNPDDPWRQIIGVVGNVHDDGVDRDATAVIFWPLVVEHFDGADVFVPRTMAFALRTARPDPRNILPEVREAVWAVNPNIPLADIRTLDDILAESMARTSFTLVMLGVATAVAVLLGTIGIYGVISYVTARRTKEIGVRMALGAEQRDVRRLVLRQGAVLTAIGVGVGVAAALGLTRLMSALLFGVTAADLVTYVVAAVSVAAVASAAAWVPARRATQIDPAIALQAE